jgi:hypothetical protein
MQDKLVLQTIGMILWFVFPVALMLRFYWKQRTGRWKRPRTYPWAMGLMALAASCSALALVLRSLGY